MTEKRFTYEQETLAKVNVFDSDGEFICCTLSVWADQLVDKLNALHEEKEEIRYYHKRQVDDKIEYKQRVKNTLQKYCDYYTERTLLLKQPYGDVTKAIHDIAHELGVDLE